MSKLGEAIGVLKEKGPVSLFKKGLKYTLLDALEIPSAIKRAREKKSLVETLEFAYSGILFPYQVRSEMSGLLSVLKRRTIRNMLEIGTAGGGSLYLFSKISKNDATLISLDQPGWLLGEGYPPWRIPLYKSFACGSQKVVLLRGDSHDKNMLDKVKKTLHGNALDFLFIDGDHSYSGVKNDFEMYSPLVEKRGLVAIHDICGDHETCHVKRFWEEIKKKHSTEEIIKDRKQVWAGIGLVYLNGKT
ncbi:MAG: class I SAM-dependent methyltransferase [Nanoarchaeota archaeon]|nr:class I SAM-dependent methyltransferase [Nanoarchaeota archaeon]